MPKHEGYLDHKCEECGKEFVVAVSYARYNAARFCSRSCSQRWRGRELQAARVYPARVKRVCERCHKTFMVQPNVLERAGGGHYCSRACRRNRIKNTCKQCGKIYEIQVCEKRWGSDKFCSWACKCKWQSIHQRGSNHPNYLGDDYLREYPVEWNNGGARKRVRCNSGYLCAMCGKSESENGRDLDIHHIDYNKNNLKADNLIALCKHCHMRTNFNRPYWQVMFQTGNYQF